MINRSSTRRTTLVAGFVALSLVAASCGSDDAAEDETTEDETTEDERERTAVVGEVLTCENYSERLNPSDVDYKFIDEFCAFTADAEDVDDDARSQLRFEVCSDDGKLFPEMTVDGKGSVFVPHGIIRFHPVDNRSNAAGVPPVRTADLANADFYVIDSGEPEGAQDHADFVSAVIRETAHEDSVLKIAQTETTGLLTESDLVDLLDLNTIRNVLNDAEPTGQLGDEERPLVVNMSFGTYVCNLNGPSDLSTAIDLLAQANVRMVASAGNDESTQPSWPAAFDQVLSVGSVETGGERSCFSNFGDSVQVWMPGQKVGTSLGSWSGTSFAAPQATANVGTYPADMELDEIIGLAGEFASVDALRTSPQEPIEWTSRSGEPSTGETFCSDGSGFAPRLQDIRYL